MINDNDLWVGIIEIYPELCCEMCNEIIHYHMDCPACGKYTGSTQYGEFDLGDDEIIEIGCEQCNALFQAKGNWYEVVKWTRIK